MPSNILITHSTSAKTTFLSFALSILILPFTTQPSSNKPSFTFSNSFLNSFVLIAYLSSKSYKIRICSAYRFAIPSMSRSITFSFMLLFLTVTRYRTKNAATIVARMRISILVIAMSDPVLKRMKMPRAINAKYANGTIIISCLLICKPPYLPQSFQLIELIGEQIGYRCYISLCSGYSQMALF